MKLLLAKLTKKNPIPMHKSKTAASKIIIVKPDNSELVRLKFAE